MLYFIALDSLTLRVGVKNDVVVLGDGGIGRGGRRNRLRSAGHLGLREPRNGLQRYAPVRSPSIALRRRAPLVARSGQPRPRVFLLQRSRPTLSSGSFRGRVIRFRTPRASGGDALEARESFSQVASQPSTSKDKNDAATPIFPCHSLLSFIAYVQRATPLFRDIPFI